VTSAAWGVNGATVPEVPEETDHHTLNNRRLGIDIDGTELGILGDQDRSFAPDAEPLERGLAIERGHYDVTVISTGLLANDNLVVVADTGIPHTLASDAESKAGSPQRPGRGYRNARLDVLLGGHRGPGHHPSNQGHMSDRGALFEEPDTPMPGGQFDYALTGQSAQVITRGAGRRPAELGTEITIRRRWFAMIGATSQDLEDLLLDG
jgi:hypothetical protein